jgi:hypothetical protein
MAVGGQQADALARIVFHQARLQIETHRRLRAGGDLPREPFGLGLIRRPPIERSRERKDVAEDLRMPHRRAGRRQTAQAGAGDRRPGRIGGDPIAAADPGEQLARQEFGEGWMAGELPHARLGAGIGHEDRHQRRDAPGGEEVVQDGRPRYVGGVGAAVQHHQQAVGFAFRIVAGGRIDPDDPLVAELIAAEGALREPALGHVRTGDDPWLRARLRELGQGGQGSRRLVWIERIGPERGPAGLLLFLGDFGDERIVHREGVAEARVGPHPAGFEPDVRARNPAQPRPLDPLLAAEIGRQDHHQDVPRLVAAAPDEGHQALVRLPLDRLDERRALLGQPPPEPLQRGGS